MRDLTALAAAAEAVGLMLRGAFHPQPDDGLPPLADGRPAGTLVLLGTVGARQWSAFAASAEANDGEPHPLDRWSRRCLQALASSAAAHVLEPSAGPPWWPFQRWARRADVVFPSPLGLLIHPQYGLWHAYRGALLLPQRLHLTPPPVATSPCVSCTSQPCLSTCPVGAYRDDGLAVGACVGWLRSTRAAPCFAAGCLARAACPVGAEYRPVSAQAAFHLTAFLRARGG